METTVLLLRKALPLITDLIPLIPGASSVSAIGKAIDLLTVAVPFAIDEYNDLAPIIKTMIAALRGNGSITDTQLAELDAFEAKIDAEFDEAALKALAEDAAFGAA